MLGLLAVLPLRRELPGWAKWTPLAALVYLIVHMRLNRVSGGLLYNYRYPIEAIVIVAPVALASLPRMLKSTPLVIAGVLTWSISLFMQGAYTLLSRCVLIAPNVADCSLLGY